MHLSGTVSGLAVFFPPLMSHILLVYYSWIFFHAYHFLFFEDALHTMLKHALLVQEYYFMPANPFFVDSTKEIGYITHMYYIHCMFFLTGC